MPVRIEIFAPDVGVGSSVVEFALSQGCALNSYSEVPKLPAKEPPKPAKGTRKKRGPTHEHEIILSEHNPFSGGSVRSEAFKALRSKKMDKKLMTKAMLREWLMSQGFESHQVPSIIKGLEKEMILV